MYLQPTYYNQMNKWFNFNVFITIHYHHSLATHFFIDRYKGALCPMVSYLHNQKKIKQNKR